MSLSPNRVVATDPSGNVVVSNVTVSELSYLTGVTSNVQSQLDIATTTRTVGTMNNWKTSNTSLEASALQFTPQPGRQYVVDARLLMYVSNVDHTASLGFRWPSPLVNSNAGVVGILYPSSDASNTSTLALGYQASSQTTDPFVNIRLGTLANVPWPVSLRAMFTTANVSNITPCAILANVDSASRNVSLLYGSHLSYRSMPLLPNYPPTITSNVEANYTLSTLGTPIVLDLQAIDPENGLLSWSYSTVGMGNIASITQNNNVFTVTPTLGETYAGSFTATFTTSDGTYSHSKTTTFTKPSTSPVISTVLENEYTLSTTGQTTTLTLLATDPENTPLTWSFTTSGLGSIASIDHVDNVFTITPSMGEANAGTFSVTFSVTDGTNTTSTSTTFTKPSTAPTLANVLSSYTLATNGTPTVVTLTATDAETSSLTYSYEVVAGSLGNIASVSASDNVFTITPSLGETDAGSFTLRFGVSDGIYTTYTNNAIFTKPSTAPVVANVNATYTLSTLGTATVITLSATDAEGSTLTYGYDVVAGSLGQIASVSQNNNVFTITPSLGETYAGSFTLRFRVNDGVNTTYTNNAVFTKPSTAPTIQSSVNASYAFATDGTPTVITIEASDAEGSPLTYGYELVSGSLGSTATIVQDTNVFTITPSTNQAHAGTFQLRFSVTDGVNTVYTNGATFTLTFEVAPGGVLYATPGTYTWVAPTGVTSVCAVCVGGGGAGGSAPNGGAGGGGGALGYKNNIAVTPGQLYTVVVGAGGVGRYNAIGTAGGDSYFINTSNVIG